MRILVISQYYPPEIGAAATRWSEYSSILTQLGHAVTILCELPNYPSGKIAEGYPKYRYFSEPEQIKGLEIIRAPVWANARKTTLQRLGFYLSFMISAIVRALVLPKYDVIIVSSPPLFVGLVATAIRPFKKAKYFLDLRDIWPESAFVLGEIKSQRMLRFGQVLEKMVYDAVDGFLLAVPGFRSYLDAHHPAHKDKLKINLMNGVSRQFLQMAVDQIGNERPGIFRILYSGNLGLAQGLNTVIDAANILREESVDFIIIGDGAKRDELGDYVTRLGLQNVKFMAGMNREALVAEIYKADVCLVPLVKSALFLNAIPSKMLEYMAVGKPVIVGIEGEVQQILSDSKSGVSVKPEDAEALADAIRIYTKDPARIREEGGRASDYVRKHFVKEDIIEKFVKSLV